MGVRPKKQPIYMQIQLPQHTKQMGETVDVIGLAIWPEPLCFQSNRTYFGESTAQEQRTQKQLCTLRSNEQQLKKCNNIRFSVCNHSFMRRPCLLHDCACARARECALLRVCIFGNNHLHMYQDKRFRDITHLSDQLICNIQFCLDKASSLPQEQAKTEPTCYLLWK